MVVCRVTARRAAVRSPSQLVQRYRHEPFQLSCKRIYSTTTNNGVMGRPIEFYGFDRKQKQSIMRQTQRTIRSFDHSTDRFSTNNEVWVTWKSPASGEFVADAVRVLNGGAEIKDLREEFVKKHRGQAYSDIDPADVKVCKKENGQVLEEEAFLKQYFVPPEGRGEGPGQSKKTALFLTLPRPNVQQPQFQVSVSIMIQLFLRRNLGFTKMLAFFSHCQCRMCSSSNR